MKRHIDLIDNFRSLAMMYVIFIHTLFWFNYGSKITRSLFLIEMPLFFAITGMSHTFANLDNYTKYILSRLERILIPYFAYAAFVITLNLVHLINRNELSSNFYGLALSWINPFGNHISKIPFLSWAIWFVPVYLIIMLLIPFLRKSFTYFDNLKRFIPIIILMIINCYFTFYSKTIHDPIQSVFFYSIWIYLGFWYMSRIYNHSLRNVITPCLGLSIISLIIFAMLLQKGQILNIRLTLNMQNNKFPPNIVFFVYTLIFIPLIALFSNPINNFLESSKKIKLWRWIFLQYQNSCYSIFLIHPISFFVFSKILSIISVTPSRLRNMIWTIPLVWLFNIILSAILGHFFSILERKRFLKI